MSQREVTYALHRVAEPRRCQLHVTETVLLVAVPVHDGGWNPGGNVTVPAANPTYVPETQGASVLHLREAAFWLAQFLFCDTIMVPSKSCRVIANDCTGAVHEMVPMTLT